MKKLFISMVVCFVLSITVNIGHSACEGDINCSGSVDGTDLAMLAVDFGSTGCGNCEALVRGIQVYDAHKKFLGTLVDMKAEPPTVDVFVPSLGLFYQFGISLCRDDPWCTYNYNQHYYGYDPVVGRGRESKVYFSESDCRGTPYFDIDDRRVSYYESAYHIISYSDYYGTVGDYEVARTPSPVKVFSVHEYNPRQVPRNQCNSSSGSEIDGLRLILVNLPFEHDPIAVPLSFR